MTEITHSADTDGSAKSTKSGSGKTRLILGAGLSAVLASTLCCIAPLILVLLGVTGSWLIYLVALAPYKPYILTAAVIFLAMGYWKIYRKPKASECEPGTYCALPQSDRINKILLWFATIMLGFSIAYPYIGPPILESIL